MKRRNALLSLVAVLALTLAHSLPVHAQVLYWIDSGDIYKNDIAAATIVPIVTGVSAFTIAVDGVSGDLFYFQAPFSLRRADLNGAGGAELITYPFGFQDMETNPSEGRVNWINSFNGQLVSVNYDGTSPEAIGGQFFSSGIAFDSVNFLTWRTLDTPGVIVSQNFDGSGEATVVTGLTTPLDCRFDPIAGMVYWRTPTGEIGRATSTGTGVEVVVAAGAVPSVTNFVLDAVQGYIYISTGTGAIWRCDLDGTGLGEFYNSGTNITELAIIEGPPVVSEPDYLRGDANNDGGVVGLTDGLFILNWAFNAGAAPPCFAAGDVNSDGNVVGLTDGLFILNWAFNSGTAPAAPFPACGPDAAAVMALGCDTPSCP